MQDRAVLGDWNLRCDSCGRKIKASQARKRWDGFWVCPEDWESRHILDYYHARKDQIGVPWTRDQQKSGNETFDVQSPATTGCTVYTVQSIAGVGVAGCAIAGLDSNLPAVEPSPTDEAEPLGIPDSTFPIPSAGVVTRA